MFEAFENSFSKDAELSIESEGDDAHFEAEDLNYLLNRFGGSSFESGLYRVIRAADVNEWNARVAGAFPEYGKGLTCFGFDWLGRVFAIDSNRGEGGRPGVLMFEPGTGEALEIPRDIISFHDKELLEYGDAALASDFHARWLENGNEAPKYWQCVGYKKPLFLGGVDELRNLELSDIDVFWHLMGQLILKAKDLPPGIPVRVGT